MDIEKFKETLEKLEMPQPVRERIVANCIAGKRFDKEDSTVNTSKRTTVRRSALIAAALSVLLCLSAIGAAAVAAGYFKDVTRADGTVVGTAYEQATEELALSASVDGDQLRVLVTMLFPDKPPYSECEQLSIGDCQIADMSGSVILQDASTGPSPVRDGKAEVTLPLDGLGSGCYQLTVSRLIGGKKADQPLAISGTWQCEFEV